MTTLNEIESAAMQLEPRERSLLMNRLAASLDELDGIDLPVLDSRWIAICEQRLADLDAGRTQALDGDAVMRELRELACR